MVLVVHRQQAAAFTGQGVELHAIVMHAHLGFLVLRGVGRIETEAGRAIGQAHRIAPGRQDLRGVARGHDQAVGEAGRDALESK